MVAIPFSRGPPPAPTQGLNPCLLQCRKTLYHLSHQESPPSKWSPFIWGKRKWSEQKPINFLERWDLEYVKSMNRRELYMLFLWHGNDWKQIAHKIIKSYCNHIVKKTASLAKEKPETIWPSNSKAAHIPNSALGKEMNRLQKFCTSFIGHILWHLHQICVRRMIENEETCRVESWGVGEIDIGVHPERRTSQSNPRINSTARSSPLHHDFLLLWIINYYVFPLLSFLNGCFLP